MRLFLVLTAVTFLWPCESFGIKPSDKLTTDLMIQHQDATSNKQILWSIITASGDTIPDCLLLSFSEDSLVINYIGYIRSIDIDSIKVLKRLLPGNFWKGALPGGVIGAVGGFGIGGYIEPKWGFGMTIGAIAGFPAGFIVGGIAGSAKSEETFLFDGKSKSEKLDLLTKIREINQHKDTISDKQINWSVITVAGDTISDCILVSLSEDSLTINYIGYIRSIDINSIDGLRRIYRGSFLKNAILGGLIGFIGAEAAVGIAGSTEHGWGGLSWDTIGALIGFPAGFLTGGLIGSMRHEEIILMEDKSKSEKFNLLKTIIERR